MEPGTDLDNLAIIGPKMAALWGRGNLRPVPARVRDTLALSDAARRLLAEYGLPAFWGGPLGIDADGDALGAGFVLDGRRAGVLHAHGGLVNTDLGRFAACLALHRTLLAEGAALSRRFDSGAEPMSSPIQLEFRAAMTALMDGIEGGMRRADPSAWEGAAAPRPDYYGEGRGGGRTYWPDCLEEYDEYAMWDAEDVYARWAGLPEPGQRRRSESCRT